MTKPNIIFLHSHNTGCYVQPYGHAVPTPNLQRFAERGVLFRGAFAASPTCSPSRAGFMTGQYPHCCGMTGLAHRGFSLNDPRHHIAHTLRGAEYHTMLLGVEHTCRDIADAGYDETYPPDLRDAADVAPQAVEIIRRDHGKPFFLSVGLKQTHRPFPKPGDEEDERNVLPPALLPDVAAVRRDMAGFKTAARQMDACWGQIFDALDESGLSDRTLVFCFSDHGLQFPRMMTNVTDHGLRVYLIVRGPGGFDGGGVVDPMVSLIDLFPTVCDVAGIALPAWLQGKSLCPLVNGVVDQLHEQLFGEMNYHAAYEPQRTVRTDRWRYIRRFDERDHIVLYNADDSPSKQVLMNHGWSTQRRDQEMLFDLIFDPQESHNLAGDPGAAAQLSEMRALLDRWMHETDDPLLRGPMPIPPGAVVNDPDTVSPSDRPTST